MTANDDKGHNRIDNGRRNGTPGSLPSRIVGTARYPIGGHNCRRHGCESGCRVSNGSTLVALE